MRILAFTDTHLDTGSRKAIKQKVGKADIVVCAGDFTIFGSGMEKELRWMNKLGKTVVLVHGNHEDEKLVREACKKLENIKFIHKKKYEQENYVFVGYGGDGFSLINKKFEKFAAKLQLPRGKKIIFVSHQPAHNTKIDYIWDHHGNKSYRKFIDRKQPVLAISGHLHETAGKEDRVKNTRLVNPGDKGKIIRI